MSVIVVFLRPLGLRLVFSSDEMFDGERRVQYSLFLQVLDVETGDVLFQNKTSLTKAIIK